MTLTNALQQVRDELMMKHSTLQIVDDMVSLVKKYVNPEDAYVYLMLDLGNYHQLLTGYAHHLIHFYREDFTPMENDHRWNEALKLIEDRPKNYYTIAGDFLKPVDKVDAMHSFETLLTNLVQLKLLQPGQQNYFSFVRPVVKSVDFDLNLLTAPQLSHEYFKPA